MTNSRGAQAPGAGNYASVNGLNMYYEIHGVGQPLVLLHGAFSAIGTSFGDVLPELAKTRQVIAFEMQAHGRTADIDRPLSMEQMADDTVAALQQLGIENADFFGFSMGEASPCRSQSGTRKWCANSCSPRSPTSSTASTLG
jgi:pimeloyl-ACP methyl ester carboxylesterase